MAGKLPRRSSSSHLVHLQTTGLKKNSNVVSISLVCIDIDDHDDARQILSNLPVVYEALGGLNFAIYDGIPHRGLQKCRVVVDADGFDPALYKSAVSWVAGRLGLLNVTSESRCAGMYRPTVFADAKIEEEHTVVARRPRSALTFDKFANAEEMESMPRKGC